MNKNSALRKDVFLNLPFEADFEHILVAYVAGLVSLGFMPKSVLQLGEDGRGRMDRLYRLMQTCGSSIHDLSYAGPERRHNMPFELGIAYALAQKGSMEGIYVFESRKRDLLKTLSDLRGFDPKCHEMNPTKALQAIYDCFDSSVWHNSEEVGEKIYREVMANLAKFRRGRPSLFYKSCFLLLTEVTGSWARRLNRK